MGRVTIHAPHTNGSSGGTVSGHAGSGAGWPRTTKRSLGDGRCYQYATETAPLPRRRRRSPTVLATLRRRRSGEAQETKKDGDSGRPAGDWDTPVGGTGASSRRAQPWGGGGGDRV